MQKVFIRSMEEEQFNRLPSQGNIYSTTRLGNVTILGSGNHGKLYALTSNETSLEELVLPKLPRDAEIVSIDAFQDTFPVLGLTYIQRLTRGVEDTLASYLQIYSTWSYQDQNSPSSTTSSSSCSSFSSSSLQAGHSRQDFEDFNVNQLGLIGRHCTGIKLPFIPYHLYHVLIQKKNETYESVFLLSGSDNEIHTYELSDAKMSFTEVPTRNYFPELGGIFESVVTRIQIECVNGLKKRFTICGCEDGTLKVYIVSGVGTPTWTTLTQEKFNEENDTQTLSEETFACKDLTIKIITNYFEGLITAIQFYTDGFSVNAVIASSLSPTYVYTNITEENFNSGACLKFSSRWDCVEAVCVADIDFDGRAEIIIGTFGCTLLVYKMNDIIQRWVIVSYKKFPSAIYSIEFIDAYLHVVSASGIHIMKYTTGHSFQKYSIVGEAELSTDFSQISISSMEAGIVEDKESEDITQEPITLIGVSPNSGLPS